MIAFARSTVTPLSAKNIGKSVGQGTTKFLRKFYKPSLHKPIRAEYELRPRWNTYEIIGADELLKVWADDQELVGVRPGSTTNQWCGDVDTGSKYHPDRGTREDWSQIEKIRDLLLSIGLESELFYSSARGGIHIRVFLPEEVRSIDLGAAIEYVLTDGGFELKNGQLEASPRIKPHSQDPDPKKIVQYQAFRLPMQQGGAYIGLGHEVEEGYEGLEGLACIIEKNSAAQDMEMLRAAMEVAAERLYRENGERYQPAARGTAAQFKEGLELRMSRGFSGFGETNELMKTTLKYGYIFLHLEGLELSEWLEKTMEEMPGYQQYCRHQHELARKARTWVRWIEKNPKYYPYGSRRKASSTEVQTKEPKVNKNDSKAAGAIVAVIEAAKELIAQGVKFVKTVDVLEAIRKTAGRIFSTTTLYKESCKEVWSKLLEPALLQPLLTFEEEAKTPENTELQNPYPEMDTAITDLEPIECLGVGEVERRQPGVTSLRLFLESMRVSAAKKAEASSEQPLDHTENSLKAVSDAATRQADSPCERVRPVGGGEFSKGQKVVVAATGQIGVVSILFGKVKPIKVWIDRWIEGEDRSYMGAFEAIELIALSPGGTS